MTNPAQFISQVRQETRKVTWPSRKETLVSTLMVIGLAAIASVFFLTVDGIAGSLIRYILGIGG